MKRLISYIPDFITSMNLLCGVIGVVFAFKCRSYSGVQWDSFGKIQRGHSSAFFFFGTSYSGVCAAVRIFVIFRVLYSGYFSVCVGGRTDICACPLRCAVLPVGM